MSVSGVAGRTSIPPTMASTSCNRNLQRVATPKLPPPPLIAPEEIRMRFGVRAQEIAVGGHNLGRQQGVDGETMPAHEVADAAGERDARRFRLNRCHRTPSRAREPRPRLCMPASVVLGPARLWPPLRTASSNRCLTVTV